MSTEGRGLGAAFLVAGVILLTAGGVALAVVPSTECPILASKIEQTVKSCNPGARDKIAQCRTRGHRNQKCALCGSTCRVSFLKRWLASDPARP